MYYQELTKVTSRESAQPIVDALQNQSYMRFDVIVAPVGGMFAVGVLSNYEASAEEITDMLLMLMANVILHQR